MIDYWGKASAAFYAVLGIAAADVPGGAISKGTAKHLARKETLDGYRQLWENSLNGKWREISRQLLVLTELQKFLKALGPIGKLDATLHAGESLYWLGMAAQQGVIRDRMDAIADAALKNATDDQRRAARACGKGGAAAAAASAGRTPPYTKLARPRAVKRLRLSVGGRKARALNKLLAARSGPRRSRTSSARARRARWPPRRPARRRGETASSGTRARPPASWPRTSTRRPAAAARSPHRSTARPAASRSPSPPSSGSCCARSGCRTSSSGWDSSRGPAADLHEAAGGPADPAVARRPGRRRSATGHGPQRC